MHRGCYCFIILLIVSGSTTPLITGENYADGLVELRPTVENNMNNGLWQGGDLQRHGVDTHLQEDYLPPMDPERISAFVFGAIRHCYRGFLDCLEPDSVPMTTLQACREFCASSYLSVQQALESRRREKRKKRD